MRTPLFPRQTHALLAAFVVSALFASWVTPALAAPRVITGVAGNGRAGYSGDGGRAVAAKLSEPQDIAPLPGGGFLIADTGNDVIRRVSARGRITTVAGGGPSGPMVDGVPATSAHLAGPNSVSALPGGGFLIADTVNCVIRKVSRAGIITTVAGDGLANFGGDNGPATAAHLFFPQAVAALPGGGYLIADSNNHRIRRVSASGTISTVAGDGSAAFGGDGGPATAAQLFLPTDVSLIAGGGYLIADQDNDRIRMVSATGKISTVAGNGVTGYSGDGGSARKARLTFPKGVAALPGGGFLIADTINDVIRSVSASGQISTVAGRRNLRLAGGRRPAKSSALDMPSAAAPLSRRSFLVADTENNRIRWVGPSPRARITSHPPASRRISRSRLRVAFRFRSSQPHSVFRCKLDRGSFLPCKSPQRYRVAPGRHTFSVRAANQFHAASRPARFSFRVRR